jgi:UDP-N-acetyl-D-glucosamine/UDP-N-acetyl-D-galactosamine dehydrogenase
MTKIAVIGLGYVGLPLALAFSRLHSVVGFDIHQERVLQLRGGFDSTRETTEETILSAKNLKFTDNLKDIADCTHYIITVPTPIDEAKKPDLSALVKASSAVGSVLSRGDIVIYESTVYPGATEEICVPALEQASGLSFNKDFYCGYSPERINPGDKVRTLETIIKITSGSTPEVANTVDKLYSEIIHAGTYKVDNIKVAEAAKVIENTQRDVNIALINEFSLIFEKLGVDTSEVLNAAATKWNFINFRPGLVGGHCIGVDPYYLTHKSQMLGYNPEIILSGRRLNDDMARIAAMRLVKKIMNIGSVYSRKILVLGFSFKENCPDVRNTKVADFVSELESFNFEVNVFDPVADQASAQAEYGVVFINKLKVDDYSAIVLATPHKEFTELGSKYIKNLSKSDHIFFDLKSAFEKNESDLRL